MKEQLNFLDKNIMRLFTLIIILLLCSTYSFGQVQLFSLNNESIIIATKDKENTIGLNLNRKVYRDIIDKKYQNILIKLPFFHNSVNLTLEKFQPYNHEINIISKSSSGDKTLDIIPTLFSYKLFCFFVFFALFRVCVVLCLRCLVLGSFVSTLRETLARNAGTKQETVQTRNVQTRIA